MIAKIMTALKFLNWKPFISRTSNGTRKETHTKNIKHNKTNL